MTVCTVVHKTDFDKLCELVAPIARRHKISEMYLFGSRARDEYDDYSDYDIYVVSDRITSLIHLSGLMLDLKEVLDSEVDIVVEDSYICDDFLKGVFRDRKLMYKDVAPIKNA